MSKCTLEQSLKRIETTLLDVTNTLSAMAKEHGIVFNLPKKHTKHIKSAGLVKSTTATTRDVMKALKTFTVEGNCAHPPTTRLSPALWQKVKTFMENNGGRWVTGKNHFLFKSDPLGLFSGVFTQGKLANRKKDTQAFYTPEDTARLIVALADVNGHNVLEPSAGHGALADACKEAKCGSVCVIENDPDAVVVLMGKSYFNLYERDFLKVMPSRHSGYDRVVMNPPFAKGACERHIKHALRFLPVGGRLVSVIPASLAKKAHLLADGNDFVVHRMPDDAFRESGTLVKTCALVVDIK